MKCPNCSVENREPEARFCGNCGEALTDTFPLTMPVSHETRPANASGDQLTSTADRREPFSRDSPKRVMPWLGVLVVVFTIGGIIAGGVYAVSRLSLSPTHAGVPTHISTSAPTTTSMLTSTPAPISTPSPTPLPPSGPPTHFSVTEILLKSGEILQNEQSYPVTESPLTITGTYSSRGSGNVWVVVQEEKEGKYYLQKPSVQFGSNEGWTASNIITAVGAIMIKFVYVTQEGQNTFQVMINANSSEFYSLPAGSEVLKDIRIQVTQSGGA